jgi:mannosyltransferase
MSSMVSFGGVRQSPRRAGPRVVAAVGAAVVVLGTLLRFYCPSVLWLDEAISVNIARLPISQIPHALSQDGAPPLYYVMLHYWMALFGQGDFAVRALSGVTSVAAMPLFWFAGRRLGGRMVAWTTFFLGVTSPFAIYYATCARMYSLMILGTLLGFLALARALERPSAKRLAALGAATGVVVYTHYWGLYLVAVTGAWLVWRLWRPHPGPRAPAERQAVARCLTAVVVGALLFVPWAPTFVFQTLHTGTPWTTAASPADLLGVFSDFAGRGPWADLLAVAYGGLVALAVLGHRTPVLRPPERPALPVFGGLAGTLGLAVAAGAIADAAFVARYAAVVLPLFLLLAGLGIGLLSRPGPVAAALGVVCLAGLLTGVGNNGEARTQATQIARVLDAGAQPGDLVVFCPDQLGPAVNRLITVPALTQLTFPRAIGPQRVDWVDYEAVIARTDVGTFAREMLARVTPGRSLWLVWANGYPGFGGDCGDLAARLDQLAGPGHTLVHTDVSSPGAYVDLVRHSPR